MRKEYDFSKSIKNPYAKKSICFNKGQSKISFSGEYEQDPKSHKDWSLNILATPNVNKPEHEHYFLNLKEIKQLHAYLEKFIEHVEKLK